MDAQALREVMGGGLNSSRYEQLLPAFNQAMLDAGITTVLRAAMWCAQLGHESAGLLYMEEIASGAAYEWRNDLGNTQAGDGVRFKGRGPIQVTGRANYGAVSRWAFGKGLIPSATYFVDNPEQLASDRYGFIGPVWYWTVARAKLNTWADQGSVFYASCEINGWIKNPDGTWRTPNGYQDRLARYNKAMSMGDRILPSGKGSVEEYQIPYVRDQLHQDTIYNCGPASTQTIIRASTGTFLTEQEIGGQLGTHTGGTDSIEQFPKVLNRHIPGAGYVFRHVGSYPQGADKDRIWDDIFNSINAGNGVVVNIVAPPSNYPKAVSPSTLSPNYGGGTVYHYIAVMGWREDGQRKVWVADSGFDVTGYFITFDQLVSLMVPKGYVYSTAKSKINTEGVEMAILTGESAAALNDTKNKVNEINQKVDKIETVVTKLLKEIMVATEQLAGPGRDENGNLIWSGWNGGDTWPGTEGAATVQNLIERLARIENAVTPKEKK